MKNPKPKSYTPAQEAQLEKAETLHIRADVITAGVGVALSPGFGWCGVAMLRECATMLIDAADHHARAYKIQGEIKTNEPVPRIAPGRMRLNRRNRR